MTFRELPIGAYFISPAKVYLGSPEDPVETKDGRKIMADWYPDCTSVYQKTDDRIYRYGYNIGDYQLMQDHELDSHVIQLNIDGPVTISFALDSQGNRWPKGASLVDSDNNYTVIQKMEG